MTEQLFRNDAYTASCEAKVVSVSGTGIELDRTVFYAMGGGQPGDWGTIKCSDGREVGIADCYADRETGQHLHIMAEGEHPPAIGESVIAEINWSRRHKLMRMHSALHVLCAIVDGGVTGGSIGEDKSRLDFDLPDTALDKEHLNGEINRLIAEDHPVSLTSISDEELANNPELVRTMSVKPPSGSGEVRVIEIEGVDIQPCGGTHVKSTGEIGRVSIGKIENKGKHNRRINVHLEE